MNMRRGLASLPSASPAQAQKATFVPAEGVPAYADQLHEYKRLMEQGATPEEAWAQTGIYAGFATGGVPVAEIDDSTAGFVGGNLPTTDDPIYNPLDTFLEHPELFEYDRTLGNIDLGFKELEPGSKGYYTPPTLHKPEGIRLADTMDYDRALEVLLHELQHGVQERHPDMPSGDNPYQLNRMGIGKILAEKYPNYMEFVPESRQLTEKQLALVNANPGFTVDDVYAYFFSPGEALARATQKRQNLSADERRDIFPEDSLDVLPGGIEAYLKAVGLSGM